MRIDEIERQMANQHSARQAFPSQGPAFDQMFEGENHRASIELQIKSAKALAKQQHGVAMMSESLRTLLIWAEQHQLAAQERERIEDQRSKDNMRYSRIAAWAGVISAILAAIAIFR